MCNKSILYICYYKEIPKHIYEEILKHILSAFQAPFKHFQGMVLIIMQCAMSPYDVCYYGEIIKHISSPFQVPSKHFQGME
jgi:hypothetical protein